MYLHIEWDDDEIEFAETLITFTAIRAVQALADGHCTLWHIENCYDTVVRVKDSDWVQQVINDNMTWYKSWWKDFVLNHYMIFIDCMGSLQVICDKVEVVNVPITKSVS